jgi:anhydro-N-acetylmuramic acid kinase
VNRTFKIIGLMSGTSLDGLDICYARFVKNEDGWLFNILNTRWVAYPDFLLNNLKKATQLSGYELILLDKKLGQFYAQSVLDFIADFEINQSEIDAIASHGQTIFHQPEIQFTCQIGCGETIATISEIPTINDFRKKDVINGGQGAPLVPIGDLHLFSSQADTFLNIGGFANLSKITAKNDLSAFDICPVNIVLNLFSQQLGMPYDKDGDFASKGVINELLLAELNNLNVYQEKAPHSLAWEWVEGNVLSLIANYSISPSDVLATYTEHAAYQIAKRLNQSNSSKVLVTGGGAKNTYLISRITRYFNGEISIPSEEIIDFKEALIFGFLGALYLSEEPNCLPSVTGAKKAVIGGVYHRP